MASARPDGTAGTNSTAVMPAALRPSAILRAVLSGTSRRNSQLESDPPTRQPTPAAAYGIQA